MRSLQGERGGALVTVLAVIIVLTTLAALILALSGRELTLSVGHHRSLEALYVAEAGAQLARASLHRFVVLGLTYGLHQRSVENREKLDAWLQGIVGGSGTLERACERAQSSSSYSGREGSGTNSLALFDLATTGPSTGPPADPVLTGSLNGAPAQGVQYRYAPGKGVFGFQAHGPEVLVTPFGTGGFVARLTLWRNGNASADRAFPECGGEPRYVFPFKYAIDVEGRAATGRRRLSLSGTFRVIVEQPSFAQYLLFNNTFGTRPVCPNQQPCPHWLSDETFDGPVHTNDRMWIAGSPVFRERVTSANFRDDNGDGELDPSQGDAAGPPLARFYNAGLGCEQDAEQGAWCDRDAPFNVPWDSPRFLRGFDRGVHYVELPKDAERQEWAALFGGLPQNRAGASLVPPLSNIDRRLALGLPLSSTDVSPDVFFPTGTEASRVDACYFRSSGMGGQLRGGIYVGRSLEALRLSVEGNLSVYELHTDPENRWVIRIDRRERRTSVLYERRRTPLTCAYNGLPNGVIVVRGEIYEISGPARRRVGADDSTPPSIHRDDALTVVAMGGIRIASDLRYQEDPRGRDGAWSSPPCTGADRCNARNLLGLYSVNGDITISEKTPGDIVIHAVLMTARGSVSVAAAGGRAALGTLHVLGGKITRYEGPIDSSARDPIGMGIKLVLQYDHRLGTSIMDLPAFPRLGTFGIRATPGLDDRPTWAERP